MTTIPLTVLFPYLVLFIIMFLVIWCNVFQVGINELVSHQALIDHPSFLDVDGIAFMEKVLKEMGHRMLEEE